MIIIYFVDHDLQTAVLSLSSCVLVIIIYDLCVAVTSFEVVFWNSALLAVAMIAFYYFRVLLYQYQLLLCRVLTKLLKDHF